ncbi:MAG: hypothetical protein LH480_03155 [Rubrivivax sp.]|nr:hypothetical protein [Rubrivivax sp.]
MGNALTLQSDALNDAVQQLSNGGGIDAGAILTRVITASANIAAVQSASSKERETYKALESA